MAQYVITADELWAPNVDFNHMRDGRLVSVELTNPTYRLTCVECGTDFLTGRRHAVVCGDQCRTERTRRLTRERVAKHRARSST